MIRGVVINLLVDIQEPSNPFEGEAICPVVVGKTGAQTLTHRAAGSAQNAGADNNNAD